MPLILVVDPNSSASTTEAIDRSLDILRRHTSFDVALMRREPADADVVACFSDPGLAALGLGHRSGIIAILDASVRRHLRSVRGSESFGRLA